MLHLSQRSATVLGGVSSGSGEPIAVSSSLIIPGPGHMDVLYVIAVILHRLAAVHAVRHTCGERPGMIGG
jgi:hypothetical protein